ncbi:related to SPS-sensor serine protease component SSY5 [Saccharomycodes ludwigii]|uniref:Related to SPS-sensor serine protease component SSY5 n=1 Tax=Saccharomycodes ludwigii TaxID=36035 RepID=A0A376BBI5_9ASCO|nr:hypothetical protein SCDLUD_002594 [Saccharomycodes ludwigii]KAH3901114.1 hypothetical protein SCDLUD_002594 [Saccharomycodes ludwigii]SSD62052.1 related to SPS-sensor serine protease component SSY5 [Saccharomycodes ludwigii]
MVFGLGKSKKKNNADTTSNNSNDNNSNKTHSISESESHNYDANTMDNKKQQRKDYEEHAQLKYISKYQDNEKDNDDISEEKTIASSSIFTRSKLTYGTGGSSMFSGSFRSKGSKNAKLKYNPDLSYSGMSGSNTNNSGGGSGMGLGTSLDTNIKKEHKLNNMTINEEDEEYDDSDGLYPDTVGKPLRVIAPISLNPVMEDRDIESLSHNYSSFSLHHDEDRHNNDKNLYLEGSQLHKNEKQPPLSSSPFDNLDSKETFAAHRYHHGHHDQYLSQLRRSSFEQTLTAEQVENELRILNENLVSVIDDVHQNVTNISKAVIQAIEFLKKFLPNTNSIPFKVTIAKNSSVRSIIKVVLHFVDNLLSSDVYNNSRAILIRKFTEFLMKININYTDNNSDNEDGFSDELDPDEVEYEDQLLLPCMKNFCIDHNCNWPNKEKISKIIDEIAKSDPSSISDQDGAFIAPVLRGLNRKSTILTVMFGLPNLQQEHFEMIKGLYSLFPDVHFYCVKDYIKPCSAIGGDMAQRPTSIFPQPSSTNMDPPISPQPVQYFRPPYRVPTDPYSPPIALSLSTFDSTKITGTLGGYLFPQIDPTDTKFATFADSTFAITCAHVVLAENQDYPYISVPSKVLQSSYKKTLMEEALRYAKDSLERRSFEEEAQRVESVLQEQAKNKFGQVVWGERSIVENKLSDFAIIKLNSKFQGNNYLGDDLNNLPDATLRFKNLEVIEKIMRLQSGMKVFKIGSTTNYTSGRINGSKLVFWANGKIQSSEFVIASTSNPLFATGGDSGAWILSKLGKNKLGLGVVGMLHSYDGEQKQFGLFSSICDILDRLHTITGVLWDIAPLEGNTTFSKTKK